jgi:glycosyltransferase involved in cell wall biosynthesis
MKHIYTLRAWQSLVKPVTEIIYNASTTTTADGYVPFSIGVSIHYASVEGEQLQIGDHSALVACHITTHTDMHRRGQTAHNRAALLATLMRHGIHNSIVDPVTYFNRLPCVKFVISPEGNGIDCHRHYESLLAGSIPIIEDHPMMREKYSACPVVYTHDYSEITPDFLEKTYEAMLDVEYDFSAILFSRQPDTYKQQIRQNGNYWGKRCMGKPWYPELSVCIPTMRRWDTFLKDTLAHYLQNPYIDEIVVCDETGEDAEHIRTTYPQVKVYVNDTQLGAFWNRRQCVQKATHAWVALLDSDNYAPVGYFEAWNTQRPHSPSVVYCPIKTLPTPGHNGFDFTSLSSVQLARDNVPALIHHLLVEMWLNNGNYTINKSTYLSAYDPTYASLVSSDMRAVEDMVCSWFIIKAGATLQLVPGMEYYHAVHGGSLYINTPPSLRTQSTDIIKQMYARGPQHSTVKWIIPAVYPISFSIPESKIVTHIPEKSKKFAHIVPGDVSTYIYSDEASYYEDYQRSVFGRTKKKAGWDCMRHYEILANGCIPWFEDLDQCPATIMTHFPKALVSEAMQSETPETYIERLLDYTRTHLTCRAMASYVMQTAGHGDAASVLVISCNLAPDYLRCLTLIGLKQLYGTQCAELTPTPHIYDDYAKDVSHLYGKGLSYTHIIPANVRAGATVEDIIKHTFDVVIYAQPHRDGMPFYNIVMQHYTPSEVIVMCGEDEHHLHCKTFFARGHSLFVRELN